MGSWEDQSTWKFLYVPPALCYSPVNIVMLVLMKTWRPCLGALVPEVTTNQRQQ